MFVLTRALETDITNDIELLVRKGVFPYDWFDSLEKLSERNLPAKESFYSKLNDCDIIGKDFEHARTEGVETFQDDNFPRMS